MKYRNYLIGVAAAILPFAPASADWNKASTDHFVIYADDSTDNLHDFALRLERYHAAMSIQMQLNQAKPSPSNRVTVYVVRNEKEVQRLFSDNASKYIGGFYVPRAGSSFAIVPKVRSESGEVSDSERVLFHEYAHHFMFGTSAVAWPLWLGEGFAEFYSTSKFERDGTVGLGLPAAHRAYEMAFATSVPLSVLLDTPTYLAKKSKSYDEFYGKSWALFHFLRFSEERKGQMAKYLNLIMSGTKEIDAATQAFGDLKQLEKELNRYVNQRKLYYFKVDTSKMAIGDIVITPLDAGQAAVMPLVIRSKRGVDEEKAKALVPEARAVAAKFPDNATVLSELAEAEFDSGSDDAAIAAADKALAIDPQNINALIQKGYALARQAEADNGQDPKLWKQVRQHFAKINKIENDHPVPLIQYYRSYKESGQKVPKLAVDGLEWALQLAPFDEGLRMMVAEQEIDDGELARAIETLKPIAYDQHEPEVAAAALALIDTTKAALAEKEEATAETETPAEKPAEGEKKTD